MHQDAHPSLQSTYLPIRRMKPFARSLQKKGAAKTGNSFPFYDLADIINTQVFVLIHLHLTRQLKDQFEFEALANTHVYQQQIVFQKGRF